MNGSHTVVVALLCAAAAGCQDRSEAVTSLWADDVQEVRRLGELPRAGEHGAPALQAPDTAEVGVPFVVTIQTVVGGCTRGGEVEVRTEGNDVMLVAYDYVRTGPDPGTGRAIVCPLYRAYHAREIPLRFDRPGIVRVHLRGADQSRRGETSMVERRVVVVKTEGYRCDPPRLTEGCR